MLSLILYGRNDSHGYNLHKRAALSLNAIAEVLADATDEIVFVDYNTPDELPTFLETIADTLTDRAKRYLRIIRVRPGFHRRLTPHTSLVALESQSRNIAIRRANPDNRWILSTNTDMIFVPDVVGESLSGVCRRLPEGFYHLPRFELPEGFWERSDRLDPSGMIERLRSYGRRYHLNEVVYGGFDNLYEAPGDFQLFLRDDLFRVGGFDETMLKGWHVDTNMARRMKLLLGEVKTAFPALRGYHCGHTRQATSLHGARRSENSLDTYVRQITTPHWTTDDTWGAPDEVFEEVRLVGSRTQHYVTALARAIPEEGPEFSEATYNETTFCQEGFDAAHVLTHLGDIVFNMPPNSTVFLVGSDRDLISGFERFISSEPMTGRLFVCGEQKSPGDDFSGTALDLHEGFSRADLVVIQYPNIRTAPVEARADLEWFAQHALERFIDLERSREPRDRRRVVVVNGMHSPLQNLISESLDAAAIPFSARIRQGRVVDQLWSIHPVVEKNSGDSAVYSALGRQRAYAPSEKTTLAKAISASGSQEVFGSDRIALDLINLAGHATFGTSQLGVAPEQLREAAIRAQARVEAAIGRCSTPPVAVPARTEISNRICSGTDWEDEEWLKLAVRYFGERAYTITTRSRWLWERVSLLHELKRRVPPAQRPWILCVADRPEVLAAMAAHQGYRVAYATPEAVVTGGATACWFDRFELSNIVLPGSLAPLDQVSPAVRFAGMLAPNACLLSRELGIARTVLAKLQHRMESEAHCGASSLVHLNERVGGGALSLETFMKANTEEGLLIQIGLRCDAPVDARIPLDAAVRFAAKDENSEFGPGLSFGFEAGANVSISMLWGRFQAPTLPVTDQPSNRVDNLTRAHPVEPSQSVPAQSGERSRSAEDALFAKAETASRFAEAFRHRILVYPAVFRSLRRNLLPSAVSASIDNRSVSAVAFNADSDGHVRFGVPIASFAPDSCVVHIMMHEPKLEPSAVFVGRSGVVAGRVTRSGDIVKVRFDALKSVGDGIAVFDIECDWAEVNVLAVWRETSALTSVQA